MNDRQLKSILEEAYEVDTLDSVRRERLWNLSRSAPKPRKSFRWKIAIGTIALAGVVVGCAYPIVSANYASIRLARELRLTQPMTVTLSFDKTPTQPGEHISDPVTITVADGWLTYGSQVPGSDSFFISNGKKLTSYLAPEHRVVNQKGPDGMANWINAPDEILAQLEHFALRRKLEHLAAATWKGRVVNRVSLTSDDGNATFVIDVDAGNGLPVHMESRWKTGLLPPMSFEYDHNAAKAERIVQERLRIVRSTPALDLDQDRQQIVRRYSEQTVARLKTGRDVLTIHSVEMNRQGDVFVLYSFKGYHDDPDSQRNVLRLADEHGTQWLSDIVNMFSGPKLNGLNAKAQVFYHPRAPTPKGPFRLFAHMQDWEFVDTSEIQVLPDQGNRWLTIGSVIPTQLPFLRPDWMHYAFSPRDPEWLTSDALKLRFLHALRTGDYRYAQLVGRQLEPNFPSMMIGFFYDRPSLYLGLYHAYTATHDRQTAREYLKKAIQHWQESSQDYPHTQDFDKARAAEGL